MMSNTEFKLNHSLKNRDDTKQKLSETINMASKWVSSIKKSKHKDAIDDSVLIGTILWLIATFSVLFSVIGYFRVDFTVLLVLLSLATFFAILLSFIVYLVLRKWRVKEYEIWEEHLSKLHDRELAAEVDITDEETYVSTVESIIEIFDKNGEEWIKLIKKYARRQAYEWAFVIGMLGSGILIFCITQFLNIILYGWWGIFWMVWIGLALGTYIFLSRKRLKKIGNQERKLIELLSNLKEMKEKKENFLV